MRKSEEFFKIVKDVRTAAKQKICRERQAEIEIMSGFSFHFWGIAFELVNNVNINMAYIISKETLWLVVIPFGMYFKGSQG